jgi:hypothetical protein
VKFTLRWHAGLLERWAIGALILNVLARVTEDMRMQRTHAHEFLGADLDGWNAQVVVEMRNDFVGHIVGTLWERLSCNRRRSPPRSAEQLTNIYQGSEEWRWWRLLRRLAAIGVHRILRLDPVNEAPTFPQDTQVSLDSQVSSARMNRLGLPARHLALAFDTLQRHLHHISIGAFTRENFQSDAAFVAGERGTRVSPIQHHHDKGAALAQNPPPAAAGTTDKQARDDSSRCELRGPHHSAASWKVKD